MAKRITLTIFISIPRYRLRLIVETRGTVNPNPQAIPERVNDCETPFVMRLASERV
jgi:hypothetical protein